MRPQCLPAFLLLVAFSSGEAASSGAAQSPTCEVYHAVLNTFIGADTKQLVVLDSTRRYPAGFSQQSDAWLLAQAPTLSPDILQRYRTLTPSRDTLPECRPLPVPIRRVSASELRALGGNNPDEFWRAFYDRYPASPGSIELSQPAFSSDGQQALVSVYDGCGGRCGSMRLVVLRKDGSAWQIEDSVTMLVH
jgi:hypothetical protein